MKKKLISLFFMPIIAIPFVGLASCNGNPTWTVMIYLCGSDLESNGGWASNQINKMLQSNFKSNVHVLVETGGATEWKNGYNISKDNLQRYEVINHQFVLKETLSTNDMSTPTALTNFINYGVSNYRANRYGFIFFDHGYAWKGCEKDDNNESKLLNPLEIKEAFDNAFVGSLNRQKFDFLTFDNCVMSNAETLCSIYPYTRQVITNERNEWFTGGSTTNCGIDYAGLFELLSNESLIGPNHIGKFLVDQYALWQHALNLKYAMASINMKNMDILNLRLIDFFDSYTSVDEEFWKITGRRAQQFDDGYNLIDLYNWMQFLPNTVEAKSVLEFFDNMLTYYFRCSNYGGETPNAHGINIYFPITDVLEPDEGLYNEAPDYDAIYADDYGSFAGTWNDVVRSWYET